VRLLLGQTLDRVYRPCRLQELDATPVPLVLVPPVYPAELAARGVHGAATVEFFIDETGAVRMPAVVRADFPELGDLLASAIRQWKFAPPTRRGRPVLVHASQTVGFPILE
jgi:TonB family protein